MQKLIVVSILVANVVLPIWASSERSARRGLKKALFGMLLFDVAYLFAMLFLYPRL
jgi:hypothetical protein